MLSATGTRTRVARVRAEYPDQLDYSRDEFRVSECFIRSHHQVSSLDPLQAREEASCFARQALYDARCACGMASESDGCGVRTHALTEWRLKPPP